MSPVPASSYVSVAGQVNQTVQSPQTQKNLRMMQGEVLQWNPDAPPPLVRDWLNNAYRRIVDHRLWYGLLVRGAVTVPTVYSTGTCTFTLGSQSVQGIGTAWTAAMIGMQIRAGYTTGWQNITNVDPVHQVITLDLPWGNQNSTSGYQIVQTWVTLGPNIKMVLDMVNQRQGWRLGINIPQQAINQWDTWRTSTGWTQMLCNKEPNAAGWPMYELWPAPTFQQTFPFLAYTQPPDLVSDGDFPLTFIRSDIVILGAIKDALLFRGKTSRYYDPTVAQQKEKEFGGEIFKMDNMDDGQYAGKSLSWDYSRWPMSQYGANFSQSHAGGPSEWP